ncbi:putative transcription factor homeobox-WOX family [Helianthus anomalus]
MEVHNSAPCPSSTHQSPSPNVDDGSGNDDEGVPATMAIVQADYLACNENGENQLSEEFRSVEREERQENKRRRTQLNDKQIQIIEEALLDHPVMPMSDCTLQRWAAELSLHGSEVTKYQLRNWLSNHRGKLARAAAKAARVHSDEDNALPGKETGSGPDPNSPEDLLDEDYDPSPSTSQLTHRKHRRRSVSRTKDTVVVPKKRFKFKVGQHVILTDDKGEEVAKGTIHLVKGVWSGKDLEESSSCVVDVEELMVPANKQPPHPTDAGSTFSETRPAPCEIKMLWKSSQLVLIQQQLP